MVAPSSTGSSLDILLRFQMDAAANDRVARGVSTLGDELKKLEGSFPGTELGKQTDKFKEKLKQTETQAKQTAATLRAEARVLSSTANAITNSLEKAQLGVIKNIASQLENLSRLSLVTGTALVGGILGFANKYVNDAEQATAVTVAWKAAQDDLNRSGQRFGAVLAQEALPLLEEGARLAEKVASFVETHPEAVRAALETGKVLIGLGAIGLLVSKGVKLFADAKYLLTIPVQLEAARLQDRAATKQLEAALLRAKDLGVSIPGKGVPAAGGGGLLAGGTLATIATTILAPIAGAIIGDKLFDAIEGRDVKFADYVTTVKQAIALDAKSIGDFFGKASLGALFGEKGKQQLDPSLGLKWFEKVATSLGLLETAAESSSSSLEKAAASLGSVANSTQFDQVLEAYRQYKQDDLAAQQQHHADRKQVISDALAAEQKVNADYASSVAKVRSSLTSSLADAAQDFAQANQKAEIDYQQQRAEIIRDGNQSIEQLQKDLQERLQKNEQEHIQRVEDLTASRDALGLAKERRRFNDEQGEARREGGQEIKQRRAEIAQRLADLAQSYEQERAQRQADHQARIAEIQQQAQERLTELAKERAEELRQIQAQKVAKIRELDAQFIEERKRRYAYFIQQVRDLDASLLGEKRLKEKYNALMIQDLDKFLATYRNKLGSLSIPGNAEGGYVSGLRMTGEKGVEYVLSHDTTRAAEGVIGGRLTQQGLLAALNGMGGGGSSVVWNDQRRFSGEYSNAMREQVRRDTRDVLRKELQ